MLKKIIFSCLIMDFACTKPDIHKVDFQNFTYNLDFGDQKAKRMTPLTVKNGKYLMERHRYDEQYSGSLDFEVLSIVYGDINHDGKDEAIILTRLNTGGTGQFTRAFVYSLVNDKPSLLAEIEGGDRAEGGFISAKVLNGFLLVDRYNDKDNGLCCPRFAETAKYEWRDGKLVEIGILNRYALKKSDGL